VPNIDGDVCEECSSGKKPNSDNSACILECTDSKIPNLANDACVDCPSGKVPDSNN